MTSVSAFQAVAQSYNLTVSQSHSLTIESANMKWLSYALTLWLVLLTAVATPLEPQTPMAAGPIW